MKIVTDDFRPEIGKLMDTQFDERFGFKYTVWFDYTKRLMRHIKAGDLLAVPNFSHSEGEEHYSILTITSVMPFHYATTGDQMAGYPVFLEKTRDEAYKDFYKQDEESTEETTKIRAIASPTGLELVKNPTLRVVEESQMPIFGGQVHILDVSLLGNIFNSGLDNDVTITAGRLRQGDVDINLKIEDLIRTHIGIFGYTGTGKSNLVSTLVYKLLNTNQPINIVIFDLMGEYTSLLSDVLNSVEGFMCFLGKDSLPKDVQDYMTGQGDISKAKDAFIRNMHVPAPLRNRETLSKYDKIIQNLLEGGKIKINQERFDNMEQFLQATIVSHKPSQESKQIMAQVFGIYKKKDFDKDAISQLLSTLQSELKSAKNAGSQELLQGWIAAANKQTDVFEPMEKFSVDKNKDLVDIMLDTKKTRPSLYIIQSEDEDRIREFAYDLVASPIHSVYGERRKKGLNSPLTLFIFDEADEFIPQEPSGSYKKSTDAVETIARRGRKFGLGVAIATQRVTYLNTNIMAQPHTYFISKLPRLSDRQRITDAFGTAEDVLSETFKFGRGDWLVISHDATGLKSVPIPVHSDNAEQRIKYAVIEDI